MLGRISAKYLRSLLQPYFEAGWTPLDVAHALDHDRDGRPYTYRDPVTHLAGWLRHRLAEHRGGDGAPLAAPSSAAAEEHGRQLAEQMRRRDAAEAASTAAAEARSAGEPTPAERAMAIALAAMCPPGSAGEKSIMTARGPAGDRQRARLALGRRLAALEVNPT